MVAPNVLSTDTLFKAQHSVAIDFVVRYIKAKLLLYNIYIYKISLKDKIKVELRIIWMKMKTTGLP